MTARPRPNRTLLWSALAVVGMLAVIIVLGTIDDANGDPLLDTPGAAFVQTIATAGLVAAAVLPLLRRTQKDASAAKADAAVAREHVANDHFDEEGKPINMRVDLDDFRNEMRELITTQLAGLREHTDTQFDGIRSDMRGVRRDVGRNTDGVERTRVRLEAHERFTRRSVAKLSERVTRLSDAVDLDDTQPVPPKET